MALALVIAGSLGTVSGAATLAYMTTNWAIARLTGKA